MEIKIRQGTQADVALLAQLYDDLNDYLAARVNYPGWRKGFYPIEEDAQAGVEQQSLFVATQGTQIAGSFILQNKQEDAYKKEENWQIQAEEEAVLVIHTFVVAPAYLGCGIGTQLLDFACKYAKAAHKKALRLDVYEKNAPAIHLYEKCGYSYIDTVSLGLEAYGLDQFRLYEKVL
ncbi:MAG: GNAT family N-acetyltransferase [Oscillospiraceae bacterium]|nr:GNAT family N-acetyltransferase [Oscillospiraceae bacterium]